MFLPNFVQHVSGDLYVQAQSMFDTDMYLKLLLTIHIAVESSMIPADAESEIVRTGISIV